MSWTRVYGLVKLLQGRPYKGFRVGHTLVYGVSETDAQVCRLGTVLVCRDQSCRRKG